jgi:hypothetical protein
MDERVRVAMSHAQLALEILANRAVLLKPAGADDLRELVE